MDVLTNLSVGSIVADSLSLNNFYIGNWDICGGLRVKDDALVSGDLDVSGNLTVQKGFSVNGSINFSDDALIKGNLVISKNLFVENRVYFDASGSTLFHANAGGFGFNLLNPTATLDISSDRVQTLYLKSSQGVNRNVLAQNASGRGVVVGVDGSSTAEIKMFVDSSMNPDGTGSASAVLKSVAGGEFIVDVSNALRVRPRTIFSDDLSNGLTDARVTVYDVSAGGYPYMYNVYGVSGFGTGVGFNAIAKDTSSNVALKMGSADGRGLVVAGGADSSGNGIMATLGLFDSSASDYSRHTYPTMNLFSGNKLQQLKTGVAVNKYAAVKEVDGVSNKYALDVNGPLHISHQELNVVADVSLQINAMTPIINQVGYAVGSPSTTSAPFIFNVLNTHDGGFTWNVDLSFNGGTGVFNFYSIYADPSAVILGGAGGALFIKQESSSFVQKVYSESVAATITDIYNVSGDRYLLSLSDGNYFDVSGLLSGGSIDVSGSSITTDISGINAMDGYGDVVIMVGGNGDGENNLEPDNNGNDGIQVLNGGTLSSRFCQGFTLNDVSVYYDGSYHVVAVGYGLTIRYFHAAESAGLVNTWSSPETINNSRNDIVINAVRVINSLCAVAVGNGGSVLYSNNGFSTWTVLTDAELNTMGNGAYLIGKNLVDIVVGQDDHFFISVTETVYNNVGSVFGHSKIVDLYAPYLFNRTVKPVLSVVGSAAVEGDLNINMGGNLLTNSSSIQLFPTNATTISIGNVAVGGNTVVQNNLITNGLLTSNGDLTLNANLIVNGNTLLNKNMDLTGDVAILGNFSVYRDVSFGGNLQTMGDVSFGGNTLLNRQLSVVGDVSFGGNALLNKNLFVSLDVSFGGNALINSQLSVVGDVSFGGNLRAVGDVSFGGNTVLYKNLLVSGDVSLGGINSRLTVGGDVSFGGNLQLGGGVLDSSAGVLTVGASNTGNILIGTNNACSTIRIGATGTRSTNVDVFIGEENKGNVTIYGNLFVPGNIVVQNQTNLEIQNKTILVNDNGLPLSSNGAGLLIRDGVDDAGRFVVNGSRLGYQLKAPGSDNVVNIDVSGMRLGSGNTKGVVGLVPSAGGDGSNFTMTGSIIGITDIDLLDVSLNARVLRNNAATTLELGVNQVLDTGLSAPRLLVLKDSVTTIPGAALDVSGNAFVRRLGVGTGAVNTEAALDVSGRTLVTANVAAITGTPTVDANGLTGCINVVSTRGISLDASGERMSILAARNYGRTIQHWDQFATLTMGPNRISSEGTALDFRIGYAVGDGSYNHVPVCTMLTTSATTGRVGINKTQPTTALDVLGQVSATSFNATSDYRIKREVVDVSLGLIDRLRPVSYYNTLLDKPDVGFLAHEVQDVLPFLVNGTKDGADMQSLNYTGIIGLLVKEVQALKREMAELRGLK